MKNNSSNHSVESLYLEFYSTLVGYIHGRYPDFAGNAEDIVQNLFVNLQKRGTVILGECTLRRLKKHARRQALHMIREKKTQKRGEGELTSLDQALETIGFEPVAKEGEPDQELNLQAVQQLEMADRVIELAKPHLSDRESILLGHIRNWAPVELSLDELFQELSPIQRQRFLPVRRDTTLAEAEIYIIRQISRSKASLQQKLRETRDSMGF
jgi:hypothetical protein